MRQIAMTCVVAIIVLAPGMTLQGQSQSAYADGHRGGATLVVDWGGGGDYTTIQEALDAAGSGDTIIVMSSDGSPAGAYTENLTFPALSITLRSSDPNDPEVVADTIIDGQELDRVVTFDVEAPTDAILDGLTIRNGAASQGGGIRTANGSPTIRNCVITDNSAEEGGGVLLWNGSVTIEDCTFTKNSASLRGGAIQCSGYSQPDVNPSITGCTITGNSVSGDWTYGGGIGIDGIDVTITGCTISDNFAGEAGQSGSSGGGVFNTDGSVIITGCTITNNTVTGDQVSGGGVDCLMGQAEITDSTISGNVINCVDYCHGGGVYCSWGDLTVIGGQITGNSTTGGWPSSYNGGGGIYAALGTMTVTDCTIAGNESATTGGGVYSREGECYLTRCTVASNSAISGGGITSSGGSIEAASCLITWNTTEYDGAGIGAVECDVTLTNCTVAMNSTGDIGFGGGISANEGFIEITNSIFWDNSAAAGPEIMLNYWDPDEGAHAEVSYSDVEGGAEAVYIGPECTLDWLKGNIEVDPAFVDVDGGDDDPATWSDNDFHLAAESPCVNTGDPGFDPPPEETDIDGEPRVQSCIVDMGADETVFFEDCNENESADACDLLYGTSFDCNLNGVPDECDIDDGTSLDCNLTEVPDECETISAGDFDADLDVDLDDFAALSACLAGPEETPAPASPDCVAACLSAFDFDADNDVDLGDFAQFQALFGE